MSDAWENFLVGFIIGLTVATLFFGVFNACAEDSIIKVAVVDTGLNLSDERFKGVLCPSGHQDYTETGIDDTDGHGTHVAGLIKRYAGDKGYCLVILKYFDEKAPGMANQDHELAALIEASKQNVKIVNLSGGGILYDKREYLILSRAYDMLLIGAAGNEGSKIRKYPGCMGLPNTRCVGALDGAGVRAKFSNYGPWIDVWRMGVNILSTMPHGLNGYMSGTSMSTAIECGMEIKRRVNHAVH